MGWFKKDKIETTEPVEGAPTGFFSTEWEPSRNKKLRIKEMQAKLATTFLQGIESIRPVGADGKIMATDSAGMDSQYSTLTTAKLQNMTFNGLTEGQFAWFAGQGFIGYQAAAMLSQNWLIDKACTMPAKDACRNGYEVTVNDGTEVDAEILEEIRKLDKKYHVTRNCVEFVRNGRIFGIRVALFVVDSKDPNYYSKPFNPDGVTKGSYRGISQIDPYWMAPLLDNTAAANPAAINFYEPTWWTINGVPIHRSHLVIMRNGELPDILKPSYLYGGIPVPQRIAERVYAAERTANEAPLLAMSKRLTVLRTDMSQVIAGQEAFEEKMTVWTSFMNNFGVKIVGGEEEIQQFDTSLADLDDVIMTQFQLVAAASGVPATKLLGTSPKGFNATGEFEEASYHEELESIQMHDLSPLVERHHLLLIRSEIAPKFGIKAFGTEVNWLPVDAETASEQAETNLKKAQADDIYINAGALDGTDVRDRLINDKASGYNGLEPITEPLGFMEVESDPTE